VHDTTEISALQEQVNDYSTTVSQLHLALEAEQRKVKLLETEVMHVEAARQDLHNRVQELKGNIQVFCHVRPILSSDLEGGELPQEMEKILLQKCFNRHILHMFKC